MITFGLLFTDYFNEILLNLSNKLGRVRIKLIQIGKTVDHIV